MTDMEKMRKQREREAMIRAEQEREEFKRREERRRLQRRHDDEVRRWTDMAVKIQKQKRADEIADAEAKRVELLKELDEKRAKEKLKEKESDT